MQFIWCKASAFIKDYTSQQIHFEGYCNENLVVGKVRNEATENFIGCDGSLYADIDCAVVGYVISNANRGLVAAGSTSSKAQNVKQAECKAILEALIRAEKEHLENICVKSDVWRSLNTSTISSLGPGSLRL